MRHVLRMKRIVEIESTVDTKIQELVKKRLYHDFQHFAAVAFENQILAENNIEYPWNIKTEGSTQEEIIGTSSIDNSIVSIPDMKNENLVIPPKDAELVDTILWGQYYRLFPTKVAVRILANLCTSTSPSLDSFTKITSEFATSFRRKLEKIDLIEKNEHGEKLSASFPENNEKSNKRFIVHNLIIVRSRDSKLDGLLPRLKFVNIRRSNGEDQIGLTSFGQDFALLSNPLLDNDDTESFSREEIRFLLNHIKQQNPDEANHMHFVLNSINKGVHSREELNSSLRLYYNQYHNGESWTDEVVNTMRGGLLGRMFELNLISKIRKGRNVIYDVTIDGKKFIDNFKENHGRNSVIGNGI
jgi:hypothetical protein